MKTLMVLIALLSFPPAIKLGEQTATLLPVLRVAVPDVPEINPGDTGDKIWPDDVREVMTEAERVARTGKPAEAIEAYRKLLRKVEELPVEILEGRPTRTSIVFIHAVTGRFLEQTGQYAEAITELETARSIADQLLSGLSASRRVFEVSRQIRTDMGRLQEKMGLREAAYRSYSDALEFMEAALADNSDDELLQSELATTMQYVASAAQARGETARALVIARRASEVLTWLVQRRPAELGIMRKLSSSHVQIGELSRKMGEFEKAESAFLSALRIRKSIESYRPGIASSVDLLPIYSSLANLAQDQKNWSEFKTYAETGLVISRAALEREPGNSSLKEKVAVFLTKMGDWAVQERQWDNAENYLQEALSLRKSVATSSKEVAAQRSLHVAFNRIGTVYRAQKKATEARSAFESGLQATLALLKIDPGNIEWRRDLSVSYNRIGDCYYDENSTDKALESYRKSLEIRRSIADADNHNVDAKLDVVRSLRVIGDANDTAAEYVEAVGILEKLKTAGDLPKVYEEWLSWLRTRIDEVNGK